MIADEGQRAMLNAALDGPRVIFAYKVEDEYPYWQCLCDDQSVWKVFDNGALYRHPDGYELPEDFKKTMPEIEFKLEEVI